LFDGQGATSAPRVILRLEIRFGVSLPIEARMPRYLAVCLKRFASAVASAI
jgi:hypothetical protein